MHGRHDGDGLFRDVDAQLQAACVDGGEVLDEEGFAQVRGVQPHMVQAMFLHLEVDGAGDDVARRQLHALVMRGHEAGAIGQLQVAALAAQRLGDEEAALLRVVQARRVELDELHVRDAAAGPPGHRDAVARRRVGVGRVAVDLPGAAGGQNDGARRQRLDALGVDVQRVDAVDAWRFVALHVARRDEVQRHPALEQPDVGVAPRHGQQLIVDGLAGGVGRMGDAAHRMAALARQVQAHGTGVVGRERHALRHQPAHGRRAALGDEAGRAFVDEAGTGVLRVAHMAVDGVVAAQHADDAALGPGRGGLGQLALGQHDDGHGVGQVQGYGEAGQAGADDDDGGVVRGSSSHGRAFSCSVASAMAMAGWLFHARCLCRSQARAEHLFRAARQAGGGCQPGRYPAPAAQTQAAQGRSS